MPFCCGTLIEENIFKAPLILTFISFLMLFSYPCNPYGGIEWNTTGVSDKECSLNCQLYKNELKSIFNITNRNSIYKMTKKTDPNPFCFVSQSNIDFYKKSDPSSLKVINENLMEETVGQKDALDSHKLIALSAILGFFCLTFQLYVAKIWNERTSTMRGGFFMALTTILILQAGSYYFQAMAAEYLTCSYDIADNSGDEPIYKIEHFCDKTVKVQVNSTGEEIFVELPSSKYTMFYTSMVLKCLNTVLIIAGGLYYYIRKRQMDLFQIEIDENAGQM